MSRLAPAPTDVEALIAAVAARCLRGRGVFDPDMPFALLGMDSLRTIEMAASLEDALGWELPPGLLLDCRDGRSLAASIVELRNAGAPAVGRDPFRQMFTDAILPPDVQPALPTRSTRTDLRTARCILLTGATGFLGGALLQELLETTAARIVCLARTPPIDRPSARVRWIAGDLSLPGLGLSDGTRAALEAEVDAVLHCGAAVNWVYSYGALRAANVEGTLALLRIASRRGIPFHFVSSLSVCYSATGPRTADEAHDPLLQLRGVRLGYAQTKIVGEALVREAGRRGLPVRIYRPALITGHSASGAYNRDDLVSALIRGCVRMGTAPDLDWQLDCAPVDAVAKAIVRLSAENEEVLHLAHERPRHWRECVLWMRMYGYEIRLVPYHAWLRQLDRDTRLSDESGPPHPLRPLRAFFLTRHDGAGGPQTLPEVYEEGRRTRAVSERTRKALARCGLATHPLDAALLETYFAAFRGNGDLPAPLRRGVAHPGPGGPARFDPAFLARLLDRPVTSARVISSGSDQSIVSELTAWQSKRASGLFRVDVNLAGGSTLDVRLKVKAADHEVIAVGEALAHTIDPSVGTAYTRWRDRTGLTASHLREIAIYQQPDPRFTRHAPALLGSLVDAASGTYVLGMEDVGAARHIDAGDRHDWTADDVGAAIEGLASLHAIWYGRDAELRAQPWIGHVQTRDGVAEMSDLWCALARHAAPAFSTWADPHIGPIQQRLIAGIRDWWPADGTSPSTLIHNDFNPRNICLRGGRLCAYDWELATIGLPQRDLAELLCFVLPPDAGADEVDHWIHRHRRALERATDTTIDDGEWRKGFRAGLYELMVNRLGMYALVNRVRRQPFLPDVVRTWRRLYQHFPYAGRR